jgi:hypothetical protein
MALQKANDPTMKAQDLMVRAHPLVLLRSNTETQMQLIVALYEE